MNFLKCRRIFFFLFGIRPFVEFHLDKKMDCPSPMDIYRPFAKKYFYYPKQVSDMSTSKYFLLFLFYSKYNDFEKNTDRKLIKNKI